MSTLQIAVTDISFPDIEIEESILSPLKPKITVGHCRTEDEVLAIARDADAVMVQWAPISRRVIEQLAKCPEYKPHEDE